MIATENNTEAGEYGRPRVAYDYLGLLVKCRNKKVKRKMSKKEEDRWRHFLPFDIFIFDSFAVSR